MARISQFSGAEEKIIRRLIRDHGAGAVVGNVAEHLEILGTLPGNSPVQQQMRRNAGLLRHVAQLIQKWDEDFEPGTMTITARVEVDHGSR